MADKKLYTAESIESLNPLEFCRLKPQVYCGSTEYSTQLLIEIVSNAIDEVVLGHGSRINITTTKTSMTVEDYGQGFIVGEMREDGKTVLEAAFSVLNTSGKYRADGVYDGVSLGNFGIGAKLPVFLSHTAVVSTVREGQKEEIYFEEGVFKNRIITKTNDDAHTGTTITWSPSEKFFTHIEIDEKVVIPYLKTLTCLIDGLEIYYNGELFLSKKGLHQMVDNAVGDKEIISHRLEIKNSQDKYNINLIMTYTTNYSSTIIPYVNTGLTESGPHITQIKSIFTREFNKFFREKKWLKEKDDNLTGDDIQEGMYLVFNLTAPGVAYDAQVKSRVTQIDMKIFTTQLSEGIQYWLAANEKEIKSIADKALNARKAREAAKKARENVREGKKKRERKIINPDKLKDAETLGQDSTLLIVEGLSAGASMAVARDINKYGILMLRGKLINAFTNADDKLAKNEEIQLLLSALGVVPGAYSAKDLRYGRVAICVDPDSDGYHIGLLVMTALQKFCPEFIREGRLCWLRAPLYIVKQGKKETYYFTDEDMNAARAIGAIKGEVQRNKGLGSLSADQAKNSMFGENQRIDVLQYSEEAIKVLNDLMGDNISRRKEFIFNNIDFSEVRE